MICIKPIENVQKSNWRQQKSLNPQVKHTNPPERWHARVPGGHLGYDTWPLVPWCDKGQKRSLPTLLLRFLFFLNFSLSLHWRLVRDSAKMNGPCPVEHILFHFVQYIMPINQQHMCKLPGRRQHSLRYAKFGQHLDDKFSFWGSQEYASVAGLIY